MTAIFPEGLKLPGRWYLVNGGFSWEIKNILPGSGQGLNCLMQI